MLGWFASACPLGTLEKTWTESRMAWLAERIGLSGLLDAELVLPTEAFFPDPFDGSETSIHALFERVCAFMKVPRERIRLHVVPSGQLLPLGLWQRGGKGEKSTIHVPADQPMGSLVATMAHELAHEVLLGGGLLGEESRDHEWVTDLLPVYLGLGVFIANDYLVEERQSQGNPVPLQQGYVPARILGYALALFAHVRQEERPAWAKHLRPDAAVAFRSGLRYLRQGGASLFVPGSIGDRPVPLTEEEVCARLQSPDACLRLDTLWRIGEQPMLEPSLIPRVQACLDDGDDDVRCQAADTLGQFGPAAQAAIPRLLKTLGHGSDLEKMGAIQALGLVGAGAEILPELNFYLRHATQRNAIHAVATILTGLAGKAVAALPALLDQLATSLANCDDELTWCLVEAVHAITANAKSKLSEHFADDLELSRRALQVWREGNRLRREGEKPADAAEDAAAPAQPSDPPFIDLSL